MAEGCICCRWPYTFQSDLPDYIPMGGGEGSVWVGVLQIGGMILKIAHLDCKVYGLRAPITLCTEEGAMDRCRLNIDLQARK